MTQRRSSNDNRATGYRISFRPQEGSLYLSGTGDLRPARGPDTQHLRSRSGSSGRRELRLGRVQPGQSSPSACTRLPTRLRRRVSFHGPLRPGNSAATADPGQGEDHADHSDTEPDLYADARNGSVLSALTPFALPPGL